MWGGGTVLQSANQIDVHQNRKTPGRPLSVLHVGHVAEPNATKRFQQASSTTSRAWAANTAYLHEPEATNIECYTAALAKWRDLLSIQHRCTHAAIEANLRSKNLEAPEEKQTGRINEANHNSGSSTSPTMTQSSVKVCTTHLRKFSANFDS